MANHQKIRRKYSNVAKRRSYHAQGTTPEKKITNCQKKTNVDEQGDQRKPLYAVGGNVNWYCHYGKL
jgi:hypothetical protein